MGVVVKNVQLPPHHTTPCFVDGVRVIVTGDIFVGKGGIIVGGMNEFVPVFPLLNIGILVR